MTTTDLGLEMQVTVLAIQGSLGQAEAKRLLHQVVEWIKMSTGGMSPTVWTYPLPDSKTGGLGDTVVQPFCVAQPLVESMALSLAGVGVTDSWATHGGFYLVIASCRPFLAWLLAWKLQRAGWQMLDHDTARVSLQVQTEKPWWKRIFT